MYRREFLQEVSGLADSGTVSRSFYGFLGPGADYASHRDVATRAASYFTGWGTADREGGLRSPFFLSPARC